MSNNPAWLSELTLAKLGSAPNDLAMLESAIQPVQLSLLQSYQRVRRKQPSATLTPTKWDSTVTKLRQTNAYAMHAIIEYEDWVFKQIIGAIDADPSIDVQALLQKY